MPMGVTVTIIMVQDITEIITVIAIKNIIGTVAIIITNITIDITEIIIITVDTTDMDIIRPGIIIDHTSINIDIDAMDASNLFHYVIEEVNFAAYSG